MKILFVCNEFPPTKHGGIGSFVFQIVHQLLDLGWQPAVIGYDPQVTQDTFKMERGIPVWRLAIPKHTMGFKFGRYQVNNGWILERKKLSMKLEEVAALHQADLIESFEWSGPLWFKPSLPLIVRIHGANSVHRKAKNKRFHPFLYYAERKNLQFAHRYIAVSKAIAMQTEQTFKLPLQPCTIVYNPWQSQWFKPDASIPKNPYQLLYVGRIHPDKGIERLLSVFEWLKLTYPNKPYELKIIGDGNRDYIKILKQSVSNTVQSSIVWKGHIEQHKLKIEYNEAALFCMPSLNEALGITALEAMACGIPIMVSKHHSGPELTANGAHGWMVDWNNIEDVAKQIDASINDATAMALFADEALKSVHGVFSPSESLQQNQSIYQLYQS